MSENLVKSQAFRLKGRLYTFTVIQVMDNDLVLFSCQLAQTILKAPKMFDKAPVVFDLALINHLEIDLQGLCAIAKEQGLVPVAVQGATPAQDTIAQCHGLAVLNASNAQDKEVTESSSAAQITASSRLITSVVRSGQQVVAKSADLIVTSSVSHGAELLADGNIHVYGKLQGRAFAGISGDANARIFCQSLEADLISIAGIYLLRDSFEPHHAPCQIYLVDENLIIEPL